VDIVQRSYSEFADIHLKLTLKHGTGYKVHLMQVFAAYSGMMSYNKKLAFPLPFVLAWLSKASL
jgi:hypothetical protein